MPKTISKLMTYAATGERITRRSKELATAFVKLRGPSSALMLDQNALSTLAAITINAGRIIEQRPDFKSPHPAIQKVFYAMYCDFGYTVDFLAFVRASMRYEGKLTREAWAAALLDPEVVSQTILRSAGRGPQWSDFAAAFLGPLYNSTGATQTKIKELYRKPRRRRK